MASNGAVVPIIIFRVPGLSVWVSLHTSFFFVFKRSIWDVSDWFWVLSFWFYSWEPSRFSCNLIISSSWLLSWALSFFRSAFAAFFDFSCSDASLFKRSSWRSHSPYRMTTRTFSSFSLHTSSSCSLMRAMSCCSSFSILLSSDFDDCLSVEHDFKFFKSSMAFYLKGLSWFGSFVSRLVLALPRPLDDFMPWAWESSLLLLSLWLGGMLELVFVAASS